MPRPAATSLWIEKRTCRVARISMAVPQVSQSPWAKWASPAENSPPSAYTGTNMRVPAESCLMSTLPAVSLGGIVRRASPAIAASAGTASVGSGGSTKPPRSSAACSRAMVASSRPRSGARPIVPMKVAQEAEPRHLDRVAVAVGLDLQDLDLQEVPGLGAVDVDRPGERVHHVQVGRRHRLQRRGGSHLAVEGVTRLQDHLVAGVAAHHRRDVRMPAVVPGLRLLAQRLRVVDPDLVRGQLGASFALALMMARGRPAVEAPR